VPPGRRRFYLSGNSGAWPQCGGAPENRPDKDTEWLAGGLFGGWLPIAGLGPHRVIVPASLGQDVPHQTRSVMNRRNLVPLHPRDRRRAARPGLQRVSARTDVPASPPTNGGTFQKIKLRGPHLGIGYVKVGPQRAGEDFPRDQFLEFAADQLLPRPGEGQRHGGPRWQCRRKQWTRAIGQLGITNGALSWRW